MNRLLNVFVLAIVLASCGTSQPQNPEQESLTVSEEDEAVIASTTEAAELVRSCVETEGFELTYTLNPDNGGINMTVQSDTNSDGANLAMESCIESTEFEVAQSEFLMQFLLSEEEIADRTEILRQCLIERGSEIPAEASLGEMTELANSEDFATCVDVAGF